jgi:hypothetical protein
MFAEVSAAMANLRSEAGLVVPTALCFVAAVFANSGARGQTTIAASPSKRVEVLRIVEAISTTRSQSKGTLGKKKLVLRKAARHTRAVAHRLAPTTVPAPAQNDSPRISTEQTGELAMGGADEFAPDNRDSPFLLRATLDASPNGQITEATPNSMVDTQQANAAHTALEHESSNDSIFQLLATLSGAMVAGGFGWYLVKVKPEEAPGANLSANLRTRLPSS